MVLVVAAGLVGVAIALDGEAARTVNGVGGLLWLAALAVLARATWRGPRRLVAWGSVLAAAALLTFAVPPSDLLLASLGFLAAGEAVAAVASGRRVAWALLVPAAWLPVHLGIAVGRAALRAARDLEPAVRTDPPPTAALVPLAMVVGAGLGGWAVEAVRARSADQVGKGEAARGPAGEGGRQGVSTG